ncbi:MAG TPA: ATP-grasp domain-containing protein [Candidatus Cybelea sp.]|nr:ATP-grasp domain-containing protein [Candidatus Cybelea sp.]
MSPQRPAEKKRLLILTSKLGYQTRGFVQAAEKLDVEVIFGTDRCHKLDDPWGDQALALDFESPSQAAREIIREMRAHPPDGVLALGDRPTPAAAYVAQAFGLAGNPPEAAKTCRNKLLQRQVLANAGLPVPWFISFRLPEDPARMVSRVRFPCVLKPTVLSASQGVVRADDAAGFERAVARLRALLESPEIQVLREPELDELLVEGYIPGTEVAIEGLVGSGDFRVLAIFDKPDPLEGPYFEETIYVTPSRLPAERQTAIELCAARSTAALGLVAGPVHAEFRMNEAGPWVLEIAPRPIGGLCSRALRFGPERISLEELLIRHALGLSGSDLEREEEAAGVMMIPVPRSGIFEGVDGIEEAEKLAGVDEIRITARLHDYVAAWPEGASYLGFIFAREGGPEQVETALRAAHAKLRFRFSPRLPVEHPASGRMRP